MVESFGIELSSWRNVVLAAMYDFDKLARLVLACIDAIRDGVNTDLAATFFT